MKKFLKPAGGILALILLASVVAGREDAPEAKRIAVPIAPPAPAQVPDTEDLDLGKLKRVKKEGEVQDIFAGRSWTPPPAPVVAAPVALAPPAPPPAPSAPPLPFKYLGRMADAERLVVFLERNQVALSASVGEKLENDYQIEGISESAVTFLYLPLGTKQILNIPAQY